MNKSELRHKYKNLANLFVKKNNYIGNMNGWCGTFACREAKKSLNNAMKIDDEIRDLLDEIFNKVSVHLPE